MNEEQQKLLKVAQNATEVVERRKTEYDFASKTQFETEMAFREACDTANSAWAAYDRSIGRKSIFSL